MSGRGRSKRTVAAVKRRLPPYSMVNTRKSASKGTGHSGEVAPGPAEKLAEKPVEKPVVSVIIPVLNEKRTIAAVIREAMRVHPSTEVIVVANGTQDGSDRIARRLGAKVLFYPTALGHDVGRSIGALQARGDVLLFLDGDMVIRTHELRPFVWSVLGGVDVALNRYSGPTRRMKVHSVVLAKFALNHLLGRPDLRGASLTAIPHALSRNAVTRIGTDALTVPPYAQAAAMAQGLSVLAVQMVDVGRRNPMRRRSRGRDPLESVIIGDHLEAIGHWLELTDERGNFHDYGRNRSILE